MYMYTYTICQTFHLNPVCHESNEVKTSRGGVFTPLWYYLNTVTDKELCSLHEQYQNDTVDDDNGEFQHPCFESTVQSSDYPWKVYDDANFFIYLHKQVQQKITGSEVDTCTLLQPYNIALQYIQRHWEGILKDKKKKSKLAERGDPALYQQILQHALDNIDNLKKQRPQPLH